MLQRRAREMRLSAGCLVCLPGGSDDATEIGPGAALAEHYLVSGRRKSLSPHSCHLQSPFISSPRFAFSRQTYREGG